MKASIKNLHNRGEKEFLSLEDKTYSCRFLNFKFEKFVLNPMLAECSDWDYEELPTKSENLVQIIRSKLTEDVEDYSIKRSFCMHTTDYTELRHNEIILKTIFDLELMGFEYVFGYKGAVVVKTKTKTHYMTGLTTCDMLENLYQYYPNALKTSIQNKLSFRNQQSTTKN